jgi:flagellar biosynthesis/type III secretory pathway protein FliH
MHPASRTPAPAWQPHPALTVRRRDGAVFMPTPLGPTAGAPLDACGVDRAGSPSPRFIPDPLVGAVHHAAARPDTAGEVLPSVPAATPAAPEPVRPASALAPVTASVMAPVPAPMPAPLPSLHRHEPEPAHQALAAEQARAALAEAAAIAAAAAAARQQQLDEAVLRALDRAAAAPPPWQAEDLASLALHLAMQLVRGELQHGPHAIDRLARGALQLLDDARGEAVVDLHPDDLAQARAAGQAWPRHPVLRPDAGLSRGSVRVRVGAAEVEDLIEHRLQALADALLAPVDPAAGASADGRNTPDAPTPAAHADPHDATWPA